MNYKNLRVFVTGAGGFIASLPVETLVRARVRVSALVCYKSRGHWGNLEQLAPETGDSLELVLGDERDAQFVRNQLRGCDVIFHLGALIGVPYSHQAAESYIDTNLRGTLNALQGALELAVRRIVFTSTREVYGTERYTPIDEAHPCDQNDCVWLDIGRPADYERAVEIFNERCGEILGNSACGS